MGYVCSDPAQDWNGEGYLSRAQDALATARSTAANACRAYDKADGEARARRRRLEHALNAALERDELYLLYQPQYRISDQSLIGAEALVRWESAEFGFVSPAEFIPIAESSGLITELGSFVLERAIEGATRIAIAPDHVSERLCV